MNINKLTTPNECQLNYDEDTLVPIYPILRSSPEDTKSIIDQTSIIKNIKQETRLAKFYIVCGCSHHVVNDKSRLTTFVNPSPNYTMGKINECTKTSGAKIFGYGSIEPLGNVLYGPQVTANLISVSQLTDNGSEVSILGEICTATRTNKHEYIVIEGVKSAHSQYIAHMAVRSIKSNVPTRT